MVYNYYCVDCGKEFRASEISFDLADLLGIHVKNKSGSAEADKRMTRNLNQDEEYEEHKFVKGKITQLNVQKLWELAKKQNLNLVHGRRVFLRVTLMDFLKIMGENMGRESGRGELLGDTMIHYTRSQLFQALEEVFYTSENREVEQNIIRDWQNALLARFRLSVDAEKYINKLGEDDSKKDFISKMRDNTANYEAGFWLEPEFFENGTHQSIYTIRYSQNEGTPFMEDIHEPLTIRGYCPNCGQPVIAGAGKYPHELVGMLGAQSAGKTSLILALISQLNESFTEYGIGYPGAPLCDSRYNIMQRNHKLYDNGWAVVKTNADSNEGTFNISFRLSNQENTVTKLITLVDIAGEQCFDLKYNVVNQSAFKTYPLIGQCSMYMLCSCIDQTGYGNADGETTIIPPRALIQIAQQIYERRTDKIPPLCLVMTKTDLAVNPKGMTNGENPFESINTSEKYEFASQLEDLKLTYNTTNDPNIRQPLNWCKLTYDGMQQKTYVSMLSCSALGRSGKRYQGNIQDIRPYTVNGYSVPFKRTRMSDLWKWILQVAGLSPVDDTGKTLPHIPSYKEYYALPGSANGKYYKATPESMYNRCVAIQRLFINQSETDRQIIRELVKQRKWHEPKLDKALVTLVETKNLAVR